MKYFVISNPQTKEIVISGSCPDEEFNNQKIDGFDLLEGKATSLTHYVENNVLVQYSSEIQAKKVQRFPFYFKWSNFVFDWVDTRSNEEKYNFSCDSVKIKRNELLYKSDWTQIANNPLTSEVQQQWATYRQELRDITQQSGYPFNVVWPTEPTE